MSQNEIIQQLKAIAELYDITITNKTTIVGEIADHI